MSSSSNPSDRAFPPVALLVGPEATLRDAARRSLRERVLGSGPPDFNEARFDLAAGGTEPAGILAAARTLPMLSPGRLVIVRGLDDRRAKSFVERDLPAYVADPIPTTCLVLEATKVDRRQKWVKAVQKVGTLVDCSAPTRPAQLRDWIQERLRERGKRPGSGVAAALYEAIGADLDRLASEIDKLVLYVGDAATVTTEQVAELTGQVRSLAIYELSDAVGTRDRGSALRVLQRLLDQGDAPLAVLGALSQHFRRLLRASECRPLRAEAIRQELGIHPFAAEKLVKQLRGFDEARLVSCLHAMGSTDAALKGGSPLAPRRCLEQLVLSVCG